MHVCIYVYQFEFIDSYFIHGLYSITIIIDFVHQIAMDLTSGCFMFFSLLLSHLFIHSNTHKLFFQLVILQLYLTLNQNFKAEDNIRYRALPGPFISINEDSDTRELKTLVPNHIIWLLTGRT